MVFKAFQDLVRDNSAPVRNNRSSSRYPSVPSSPMPSGRGGMALLDPSTAIKASSDLFSRNALEFVGGGGNSAVPYSEEQLLNAYLTSVYLFAALRRVANLISRVKVVGEIIEDGSWVRLPETHRLNQLFTQDGSETMSRIWLNHAVYGASSIYKIKTRRATLEEEAQRPIYDFKDGAVSGLYVLDKPMWDIDEEITYGQINGLYVNQYNSGDNLIGNRNYIERKEFVYVTDWNPHEPNRGMPLAAVCIHEAVANASIAQWISEYFTRGAMPFIMVSMAEDDPALMTDSDLRKYKKQFEDYWQGMGSSLRSVFFDRAINVEQVGIPADEVAAPELNETALEGISATIGLDRELIVTPSGGSQERHALLIKRAWEDTVIPLAEKYVSAFNRDLGLPEGMRLVVDVSGIAELEADRDNKADTEINIYESQLQSYNEARTRLQMPPIDELDDYFYMDGRPVPIQTLISAKDVPHEQVIDYAMQLWGENLAYRSDVLSLLGRDVPDDMPDGYKYEIEERVDLVTSMWGDDLLTRTQVLTSLGFETPETIGQMEDGYRSELERGADYGEWVTQLWDDNLLTRGQVLQMLDLGLELPENAPDGYADEIGDRKSNAMDMWGENLLTRSQTLGRLGVDMSSNMIDGYVDEIEMKLDRARDAEADYVERVMDYWGDNLLTRGATMDMLRLPSPDDMIDGFQNEVDAQTDSIYDEESNSRDFYLDLWGDNLVTRSDIVEKLGISIPDGAVDGYQDEVDALTGAMTDQQIAEMKAVIEARELAAAEAQAEATSELEGKSTGTIYRKPVTRSDGGGGGGGGGDDDNNNDGNDPDPPPFNPPPSPPPAPANPPMDFAIEELDDTAYWQGLMNEYALESVADDLDGEKLPSANDNPYGAAEEDWLVGGEDTDGLVLESYGGGMVDLIPDEALPHADSDVFEHDGVVDYDEYWDESEIEIRGNENYGDGDYYEASVAPNATPIPPSVATDDEWTDDVLYEDDVFDNILNPPVTPLDEIWGGIVDDIESDFDEAVEVIEDPSESTIASIEPDTDVPRDLYVSLWIGDDERLVELRDRLSEEIGDDVDIDWQDPETYHVTLAYAPNATDEDMNNVMGILPDSIAPMLIEVENISTFDNEDATVIKLGLARTDELDQVQSKIAMAFNSFGIRLSEYSDPADYKPHITLGVASSEVTIPDLPLDMMIKPVTIYMGRDGYDMVDELPLGDVRNILAYEDIETVESVRQQKTDQVRSWYKRYKTANEALKRGDPIPDEANPPLASPEEQDDPDYHSTGLPDSIYQYMMEFIISDTVNDKVIIATMSAVESGAFDKDVMNTVNPIKQELANQKAVQDNVHDELNAWYRATMKKGLKKALKFETSHVSPEMTDDIKSQLSELASADKESMTAVFDSARQSLNNES